MLKSGTAKVRVEAISVAPTTTKLVNPTPLLPYFIQVLVTSDKNKANQLAVSLSEQFSIGSQTIEQNGLHKLRLGPLADSESAELLLAKIKADAFPNAFLIRPN
jgi:rare lipoprotein A